MFLMGITDERTAGLDNQKNDNANYCRRSTVEGLPFLLRPVKLVPRFAV